MNAKNNSLMILGAAIGGALGYAAFFWLTGQGLYALVLPGGLLGLGASLFRSSSRSLPILCGIAGLALGLLAEWRFRPFIADASLPYFLTHVHELRAATLIMVAVGGAIAFWLPWRNRVPDRLSVQTGTPE